MSCWTLRLDDLVRLRQGTFLECGVPSSALLASVRQQSLSPCILQIIVASRVHLRCFEISFQDFLTSDYQYLLEW